MSSSSLSCSEEIDFDSSDFEWNNPIGMEDETSEVDQLEQGSTEEYIQNTGSLPSTTQWTKKLRLLPLTQKEALQDPTLSGKRKLVQSKLNISKDTAHSQEHNTSLDAKSSLKEPIGNQEKEPTKKQKTIVKKKTPEYQGISFICPQIEESITLSPEFCLSSDIMLVPINDDFGFTHYVTQPIV